MLLNPNTYALFKPIPNLSNIEIKKVAISELNPKVIYAASSNSLFKTKDRSRAFQRITVFKDEDIQHIFFDKYLANTLYVATSRHLYRLRDNLKELYSCGDDEIIFTAAKDKTDIYLGTNKGLYRANSGSLIWRKSPNFIDVSVYDIDFNDKIIYLATDTGIHQLNKEDNKSKRLFVMRQDQEAESTSKTKLIKIDIFDDNKIWAGTNLGLFLSEDKGETWKKIYKPGIDNVSVNCIAQIKLQGETLYLGTANGFYVFNLGKDRLKQIFEGLYSNYINWVEFDIKGKMYLATSKGLFSDNYFGVAYKSKNLRAVLSKEPSINEIQRAALRYNEVSPEKIAQWRRRLKYRGLFPSLKLNYDKTIYGTAGGATYEGKTFIGPRDWGVSFSWDIGDLVWNTYEDDVDTRARLNTQLRLDIIDEINRVYFERIRLKAQIEKGSLSKEDLFKQELRLLELTAILDGYTGGYFSQRKKELNEG